MRAAFVEEFGGPENIVVGERPDPRPGAGEVVVEVEYAGVNFMDTGMRMNVGDQWTAPQVLGAEGAGRVRELGEGVRDVAVGDRVAWALTFGSYAERVVAPVETLVPIPDDIGSDVAAAVMMQGLTAHHFVEEVAPLPTGATALVLRLPADWGRSSAGSSQRGASASSAWCRARRRLRPRGAREPTRCS